MGKQWAALLVVGALFAGACGTSRSDSSGATPAHPGVAATTPTSRRAPTSTTPTTVPAYSFDDSVPPPKLRNTGTDYVAILKSLLAYGDWTTAYRPAPELVDSFVASGTALHRAYVNTLTTLRDRAERYVEVRVGQDAYTIVSRTSDAFSAQLRQHIVSHRIVDTAEHTIEDARFRGDTAYRVLVVRTAGLWYLASISVSKAPTRIS